MKTVIGVIAGCSALAVSASPAAAAPVTVSTDAGTTCTLNTDARVGAGLVVKPVDFTGDIDCSSADAANPPIASAGLILRNSGLPLGLGEKSGVPNSSDSERIAVEEGFTFRCEVAPDADCGFNGRQPLGLPGQTYRAVFGAGITPPNGETWNAPPAGCTTDSAGAVACSSEDSVTVR